MNFYYIILEIYHVIESNDDIFKIKQKTGLV